MPLYVGDYLADTAHLTTEQHGAYLLLILSSWASGPPADNEETLAAIARLSVERWRTQAPVLRAFFSVRRGLWRHTRIEAERARASRKYRQAVESGRKGGESKAANGSKKPRFRETGSLSQKDGDFQDTVGLKKDQTNQSVASHPTIPLVAKHKRPSTNHNHKETLPAVESLIPDPSGPVSDPSGPPTLPSVGSAPGAAGDRASKLPPCPHLEILALWQEVLPAMPQHSPDHWHEARRAHLQARWRETAAKKSPTREPWKTQDEGLDYFRKLFVYIGQSKYLTGQIPPRAGSLPFVVELEWVAKPANWAKIHEGKYHQDIS